MPELDKWSSQITPNALTRKAQRNGKVYALHKIEFPATASMQLKGACRILFRRLRELNEPVERVIQTSEGEQVIKIRDDAALCLVTRALRETIEQRRIILRIPEPARDTPLEAKTIDLPSASILSAAESEGGEGMAAGTASEPSVAQDASPSPKPSQGS